MYEATASDVPDRFYMTIEGLSEDAARFCALRAQEYAREEAPKLSGKGAKNIEGIYGEGYIGLYFPDKHMFYQDAGINPFTMHSLAGKTIPMWVNDEDGEESRKNPKSKKRTTADGRQQVLIFRKAALPGQRKKVVRDGVVMDTPASYPGAPGRIRRREPVGTIRNGSRVGGRIARHNVGVRWRHPGLKRLGFLRYSLQKAAEDFGLPQGPVRDTWGRYR